MKQSEKPVVLTGILLLCIAAVLTITLMIQFLNFGISPNSPFMALMTLGYVLFAVYGYSCILIPIFLFSAAIIMFLPKWTVRRAVILAVSIIPFYTIVAIERVCRSILPNSTPSVFVIKLVAAIVIGGILIGIEYLATSVAFDAIMVLRNQPKKEKPVNIKIEKKHEMKDEKAKPLFEFEDIPDSIASKKDELPNDVLSYDEAEKEDEIKETSKVYENEPLEILDYEDSYIEELDDDKNEQAKTLEPDFDDVVEAEFLEDIDDSETSNYSEENDDESKKEEFQREDVMITQAELEALNAPMHDNKEVLLQDDNYVEEEIPLVKEQAEVLSVDFDNGSVSRVNENEKPVFIDFDKGNIATSCPPSTEFHELTVDADLTSQAEADFMDNPFDDDEEQSLDDDEDGSTELEENSIEEIDELDADQIFSDEHDISDDLLPNFDIEFDTEIENKQKSNEKKAVQEDLESIEFERTLIQDPVVNHEDPIYIEKVPSKKRGQPYSIPTEGILTVYPNGEYWVIDEDTKLAAIHLKETLSEFKIEAEVTGIRKGPVITMFEILPAPGVKLSKIVALQDNIALRLAASSVRIVAPIPGKMAVGIEVPNKERSIVSFKELIENDTPAYKKMAIPVILGKDITGEAQMLDLAKTPHLLIAGSTGSGKSVCVNTMILSILYKRSPQEVRMILIDPKVVELKLYNDIPHLLTPVITEPKKAFQALQYCLCEMERRYSLLDGMGVRDISSYNKRIIERKIATEKLPYIVVIIDEFADLMATTGKELESTLARLAAMSRAVGIHLVLATQRPSIDVITGLIKANIPTRIAFMVASKMDSRIIIDQVGAEKLLGRGDMLYASATDPFPVRIQGTFVSDNEVENVVDYVKQFGEPDYIDDEIFVDDDENDDVGGLFSDSEDDPLYDRALEIVLQAGKASASYIQRRLKIGYNRAARLVENMEARGIVGPANGSKPREIVHVP